MWQVTTALSSWNFDEAQFVLERKMKQDVSYFPKYCCYLADIGKLDMLQGVLDNYQLCINDNANFDVVRKLKSYIESLRKGVTNKVEMKLYDLLLHNDFIALVDALKKYLDNDAKDLDRKDDMMLLFSFHKLAEQGILDTELSVLLIRYLFVHKDCNIVRKKRFLALLIDYFSISKIHRHKFYRLRYAFYNHIQMLFSMLGDFSGELGGRLYLQKLYNSVKLSNNLALISQNTTPKIAVCISGMYRGGECLQSIYDNIVSPLNADVFFHTWDIKQDYIGGSRRNFRFWHRTFLVDNNSVPLKLQDMDFLSDNFQSIFKVLMTEHTSKLELDDIKRFKFSSLLIENQNDFIREYKINENYVSKTREKTGSLNQIKMLYGMYKSFSLMKSYELSKNISYEYVVRVRPDASITKGINIDDLSVLDDTNVCITTGSYGPHDVVFYAKRTVYESIVNIFVKSLEAGKLSPFVNFPEYDAHALLFAYLLHCNIIPHLSRIDFLLDTKPAGKIPNLKQAIIADLTTEKCRQFPKECQFLNELLINYID